MRTLGGSKGTQLASATFQTTPALLFTSVALLSTASELLLASISVTANSLGAHGLLPQYCASEVTDYAADNN